MAGTERRRAKNRLASETSPYLLQHATNPVDWYPWGPEALNRAKELDRPILLSIGYAACHWCHVMERESFEDDAIAERMNEHFVCIKVDREERPDLDEIYMAATMALSGSGGWPMTVFLTPDQKPFFAGTYFPPTDRYGRPGLPSLLERIAALWSEDRASLDAQAAELTEHVRAAARPTAPSSVSRDALRLAYQALGREFDPRFGGFGNAPKFPPSSSLSLLLRFHRQSGEPHALEMVQRTLDGMKDGGMYDQLGGGFARYSVDERWLVPHFEKMLYDNAQLADVYLEAYAVTGDDEYRRVAAETLDYVAREMQSPSGGYFSSSDADSEGEEGKYFVWHHDEVRAVLGEPLAERFSLFSGVLPEGNWEGKNVLHRPRVLDDAARELGISTAELARSLDEAHTLLLEARGTRIPPGLDDKVLASWNGLMIGAMAHGHRVLGEARYLESACRAANYVLSEMRRPDGGLYRTARGDHAHLDAYLEDYAFLCDGLVSLYETSGITAYLAAATRLAERLLRDFADPEGGAFYHTAHGHEALISRTREGHDGALPSPNSIACRALGRLAAHLDRPDFREHALTAALAYGRQVQRVPRAFPSLLGAVDFLLEPPLELVFAGDRNDPAYDELVREVARVYLPNRIEAHAGAEDAEHAPPLARGKHAVDGRPALYLCEGFTCQAPLTDPEAVRAALAAHRARQVERALSELGRKRLSGRASSEGTARLAARSGLAKDAYAALPAPQGALSVCRVGFGGYRVGLGAPEHRAALRTALERGVNLLDTAPSFALGDSERLFGECLASLVDEGRLARDEVVVVTKLGLAQGADRARIEARMRNHAPYEGVVWLDDEQSLAYGVGEEFLRDQLSSSLERLGLEHVDVCLLQNPEHLLTAAIGDPAVFLMERLTSAFRHLEAEVKRGRIGCYGVSTNSAGAQDDPSQAPPISVELLLRAATSAGGTEHHFRVLELPLNLAETGALRRSGGEPPAVEQAVKNGLAVLANRPLNAFVDGAVVRLAEPPELPGEAELPELGAARRRVAALEAELEQKLAPMLRALGVLGKEPVFAFGGAWGQAVERAASLQQFEHLEATVLMPTVRQRLTELDSAFSGAQGEQWRGFRTRYVEALGVWLGAARSAAGAGNRRLFERVSKTLKARPELASALAGSLGQAPWAERSLALVRSVQGITSVLVGMRTTSHVDAALTSLSLEVPPLHDLSSTNTEAH